MKSYTLDNIERGKNGLYDIFKKTVVEKKNLNKRVTYVQEGEEMRLDKISDRIYNSRLYVEELMALNNINNIWEINIGDPIVYLISNDLEFMHQIEVDNDDIIETLSNPNKNTRQDDKRKDSKRPPSIKPKSLKIVDINKENNKIKIMNRFK